MSLQVWLPLNGSLENQGLSDTIIMNNGATINNNGKIGKCYSFDGSDDFISLSNLKLYDIFKGGAQQFSIAFWVYHADATRAIIFGDYGLTGSISFNIELTTAHAVRFYWAGAPDKNFNSTSYVAASAWTHICLTYNGSKVQIYRNGILSTDTYSGTLATKNKTSGVFYLGRDNRTGTTTLNGRLNDFRIYDHCLSDKEVEEISKGLILHYKLDNDSMGNLNILTGTYYNSYDSSLATNSNATNADGKWAAGSGGNGTFSVTIDPTCPVGIYSWNVLNNTSGNRDFQQGNQPYVSGQKYTTSFWAKGNGTCLYRSWNSTDGKAMFTKTWTLTSNWTYYTYTFTASAEMETDRCTFHLGVQGSASINICGMKMELGEKATAYSVAKNELGVLDKIYDSSGYGNHGTIVNTLSNITSGIPRYDIGTWFSKSPYVKVVPFNFEQDKWTVSFWYYKTAQPSAYEGMICLSKGNGADANKKFAAMPNNGYIWFKCESGSGRVNSLKLNEWVNIVFNSIGEVYENGVKKTTLTPGTLMTDCTDLVIGARASAAGVSSITTLYEGGINDVRIYSTVLTEAQIKELYNTSATIDNLGNVYTREVIEE